jgi:translation initiation factor IF-3
MPSGDPVLSSRNHRLVSSRWGCFGSAIFFFLGDTPIARPLRINDQIRIRQVRVIDENGEQLGVIPTDEALARARTAGLDLIEVSPTAQPPVCKIADYGRLKYEQSKKDKDARKKQRHFELKEVKLRPKIETHDYETKARMAERLLIDGSKIKVTIMFRGREITYTAFGRRLLDRMAEDMAPLAAIEREPRLEGRNMFMILAPRERPTGPPKFSSLHKEHKEQEEQREHAKHPDHHKNEAPVEHDEDDVDDIDEDDDELEDDAELENDAETDEIDTKEPTSA